MSSESDLYSTIVTSVVYAETCYIRQSYIIGLVQEGSISSALSMEILQSYTKPSIYDRIVSFIMLTTG